MSSASLWTSSLYPAGTKFKQTASIELGFSLGVRLLLLPSISREQLSRFAGPWLNRCRHLRASSFDHTHTLFLSLTNLCFDQCFPCRAFSVSDQLLCSPDVWRCRRLRLVRSTRSGPTFGFIGFIARALSFRHRSRLFSRKVVVEELWYKEDLVFPQ